MFSIYQWIGNCILPQFDHNMSSLGLLEAKINLKQRTMAIIVMVVIYAVMVVV